MTQAEARERVARGAAHLDQVRPGWYDRIDVGTLTLHDPCGCIVGQLCWSEIGRFRDGLHALGLLSDQAKSMGMDRDDTPSEWGDLTWMTFCEWSAAQYALLQDAWIEAIADRRMSRPSLGCSGESIHAPQACGQI